MKVGIVVVGDEILAGHTQDANSHFLARALAELGADLVEVRTIGDVPFELQMAVYELQERREAEVVFTTGGLGSTHDDCTIEAVARLHGVPLVLDDASWARLREDHARLVAKGVRDTDLPNDAVRKMCMIPKGAISFINAAGAAPGVAISRERTTKGGPAWTVVLPGVPQELRTLWDDQLRAFVEARLGPKARSRIVRSWTYEGRESEIAKDVGAVAMEHRHVLVGSYPRWGEGRVVLRVSGNDEAEVDAAATALETRLAKTGARIVADTSS